VAALIFVVEDADDFRATCVEALLAAGHRVESAVNGQEALTLLRAAPELPRLIILDVMMPEMDGYAFREGQLRDARVAAIPVLVMTAGGEPLQERLVGTTFLSKLAPLTELFAVVERLLRG
jgi:CheY-like chemotaxis protein